MYSDVKFRIVGYNENNNHEESVSNFFRSITMYSTGSAAGSNDPTKLFINGSNKISGNTDKCLVQ